MTRVMLGGIRLPIGEEVIVTAVAKSFGYPEFDIAGIRIDPIAAVSADAEPEMPPKNMLASILLWARPPVICPTSWFANLTSLSPAPLLLIISPARIKSGMASSEKDSILVAIRCTTTITGLPVTKTKVNIPLRASENGMGILISKKTKNRPNKTIVPIFLLPRHTFQL